MSVSDDKNYSAGFAMAYRSMLAKCLRELHAIGASETTETALARAQAELLDVRNALRRVCERFGDNDWDDNLALSDVIEKHLELPLRGL